MPYQRLEEFIKSPAPGFRCSAAGNTSNTQFIARVRHIPQPAASPWLLESIHEKLGGLSARVVAFYQQHNGIVLYRDTLSEAAGFELLPIERWDEATEDLRDTFDHLADEPENDPDCIATGIAIATVPHSGNYFVMPIAGPTVGKIFYADHDGWYESAFADDFDQFLVRLTQDPVNLLNEEFGCYTRYSDGKTNTQWIPEEYYPDASRLKA